MRKFLKITSIILLLLTAVSAAIAGILLIIDPSGQKVGLSLAYIKHSPFTTFTIPGMVLLIANGLLNFVAVFTLLKNKDYAPIFVIFQGLILIGWIVIQVFMVKDISPLHITMFSIGLILIICGYLKRKSNNAIR